MAMTHTVICQSAKFDAQMTLLKLVRTMYLMHPVNPAQMVNMITMIYPRHIHRQISQNVYSAYGIEVWAQQSMHHRYQMAVSQFD